ncbi:MAG: restriction endonuclease subunit S [Opitutales bacterium]
MSSGYIVLKSNEENKRYLNYMMHRYDVAHMKLLGSGVRQTINYNHISDSLLPIPSKPEQIAIANFLDDKVGRIDEAIAQKERLIQLLNERKQIIIQNAVTKGLNPNAPMRDSGIEWIGKIPEHWEVAPLYSRCEVRLGKMLDSKKITGKKLGKYLRNIDVQWFRINTDNLPLMDFEKGEYARYGLKSGDLLVCEGGEPGRCAVWNYETPCYYQKALHRIRPKRGDLPLFIALQLRNAVENAAFSMAGKATIAHLTGEQLRPFRMLFPSVLEQNDIINHVQQKCDRIGRSIQHQINIIEQLKEYKATLINSAVTGKINVSNYGL